MKSCPSPGPVTQSCDRECFHRCTLLHPRKGCHLQVAPNQGQLWYALATLFWHCGPAWTASMSLAIDGSSKWRDSGRALGQKLPMFVSGSRVVLEVQSHGCGQARLQSQSRGDSFFSPNFTPTDVQQSGAEGGDAPTMSAVQEFCHVVVHSLLRTANGDWQKPLNNGGLLG